MWKKYFDPLLHKSRNTTIKTSMYYVLSETFTEKVLTVYFYIYYIAELISVWRLRWRFYALLASFKIIFMFRTITNGYSLVFFHLYHNHIQIPVLIQFLKPFPNS